MLSLVIGKGFQTIFNNMIKVGNKIRKIRELKNLTPKDMGDRLGLTPQGYTKIENETSGLSVERLLEIADILGVKPEEILNFDEQQVFNNYGEIRENKSVGINNIFNNFPEELKKLYEENSRLQEEKNKLQAEMIEMLKEKLNGYEGK